MMRPIRVLVADDHAILRAGVRALLKNVDGVLVVAEAGDGAEAIKLIEAHCPDILMTDIAMPILNGLELTARVSVEFPKVKTIIMTMHSDEEYVCQALHAGAAGYLLKSCRTDELWLSIQAVARGEPYLSPLVSQHVIADYIRRTGAPPQPERLLTPRQNEVLRLIARGQTTKSIAQALRISVKTVETHRAQLMERLDIRDLAGLVRFAIRNGLATPDE